MRCDQGDVSIGKEGGHDHDSSQWNISYELPAIVLTVYWTPHSPQSCNQALRVEIQPRIDLTEDPEL